MSTYKKTDKQDAQIERVSLDKLIPYARNARTHSDAQVSQIAGSIKEFGFCNPVLIDKQGGIIAGHGRVLAAQKLGLKEIPTITLGHLNETQKRAYILADNKLALNAGWDEEMLKVELESLKDDGFDLALAGFDDVELGDIFSPEPTDVDAEPQIDKADELREKWGVETGQLWELGDHRLLCGDSTKKEDVERVMGGGRAQLCLTDPPYGLGDSATDKNDYCDYVDSQENLKALIEKFLPIAKSVAPIVVLSPGVKNHRIYPAPDWTLCWFSSAGVGRGPWGFCCWQPLLAYGKDPQLASGRGSHPDGLASNDYDKVEGHPCAKPMSVWCWFLKRCSTSSGDIVYEPFSGSGTTIIACEQLNRKCRAIEISPAYVAVAIQRWADATGQTPVMMQGA